MKRMKRKSFMIAGALLFLFILFTIAVIAVDVQPIGPNHSSVGLGTINGFAFNALGTNLVWYKITDWLGLAPILVAIGFTALGLAQLVKRRSIKRVDGSLVVLAMLYCAVIACYTLFEVLVVNYRPVLIGSELEASYPSSHTMIVVCIMTTALLQLHARIDKRPVRIAAEVVSVTIMIVTVIGRLLAGVHWSSDIVGSILLASSLSMFYYAVCKQLKSPRHKQGRSNE